MSRHTSPGPSHPHSHPQNFQQVPTVSNRQKQKSIGIAAGAEDVKYQAKYKELKRKVKEIEADNDKLHFKVLQAKRSIQRMKLERAVLYERLSAVPPSPDIHDRHSLPPIHTGPGVPPSQPPSHNVPANYPHREARDHPSAMEPDHTLVEYIRTSGNPRVAPGPDGRPIPVIDTPMGPGVAPSSHGLAAVHPSRRSSGGSGHDSSRQLPPLPHLPPVQHLETSRGHSHSHSHSSPHMHHPSHTGSSHERTTRSHSSSRSRSHQVPAQSFHPGHPHPPQHPENLPPVQHVLHSPPLAERERPRRHDVYELTSPYVDPHGHPRHQTPMATLSPRTHTADARTTRNIHTHQRMGPGTYINRGDDHHERERELDRERDRDREWERNHEPASRNREIGSTHMHSPPLVHRSRNPTERGDYQEHHISSRTREDQGYYHDGPVPGGYPMLSRSGTPGSGSGSGSGIGAGDDPSRPDSRTQFYEHDRPRSYRLRPVNQPNEDIDFVHEDGRSQSRDRGGGGGGTFPPSEQGRPSLESRKRTRNDMEVDGENVVEGPAGTAGGAIPFAGGHLPEDRGSKRFHRDSHLVRGIDRQDDDS